MAQDGEHDTNEEAAHSRVQVDCEFLHDGHRIPKHDEYYHLPYMLLCNEAQGRAI